MANRSCCVRGWSHLLLRAGLAASLLPCIGAFDSVPLYPVGDRQARQLVRDAKRALRSDRPTDLQVVRYARTSAWRTIRDDPAAFLHARGDKR